MPWHTIPYHTMPYGTCQICIIVYYAIAIFTILTYILTMRLSQSINDGFSDEVVPALAAWARTGRRVLFSRPSIPRQRVVNAYLTYHTYILTIWDSLPDALGAYHMDHTYILTIRDLLPDAPQWLIPSGIPAYQAYKTYLPYGIDPS